MKTQLKTVAAVIVGAIVLALAGGRALADTTNFWGSSSGNFNTAGNWTPGTVPNSTIAAFFTNAGTYTVQFTASVTNESVHVGGSNNAVNVTFDLNGNRWRNVTPSVGTIGWFNNAGETGVVNFSSSSAATGATGNQVDLLAGSSVSGNNIFGNVGSYDARWSVMNINTNLGYAVTVQTISNPYYLDGGRMTINIDGKTNGASSTLIIAANSDGGLGANVNVTGGGVFSFGGGRAVSEYSAAHDTTWNIINGTLLTGNAGLQVGWGYAGYVSLSNGTWNAGGIQVGQNNLYSPGPWAGAIALTNSTLTVNSGLLLGNGALYNARLQMLNSTMTISNGYMLVSAYTGVSANKSIFVMSNSTVNLGSGANLGGLTNRSIMQATGTISGKGTGNALFRNEGMLLVGTAINPVTNITIGAVTTNVYTSVPGVLTLNKGSVELAAGSSNYFQFSDTTLAQIVATNGYARLQGTNIFSLAMGAATPVHGVKYGLGAYDFVIGTNVTSTPQYDNLVNLLTNKYHLQYGVDFQYGVVSLGGGLFALELAFVPEPSTVMLLALGGLLVWRRMAKRGKTVAK